MKKLLSLLSVLTISGTSLPTTIAASSYQKEENINSDINYQQTNNLKTLIRDKRQNWGVSISTTFPTTNPKTKKPTGRQAQINIGLGNKRITEPQNYNCWGHNTNANWTNQNTRQPSGFGFNFGENYPNANQQQYPTYGNQQQTFNPNAPSKINPGITQGQDIEEFSRGMQEIERLANQQRRNY